MLNKTNNINFSAFTILRNQECYYSSLEHKNFSPMFIEFIIILRKLIFIEASLKFLCLLGSKIPK